MEGNTTAPAADAVWLSVAAVRGPNPVLEYQSLAFSPKIKPHETGKSIQNEKAAKAQAVASKKQKQDVAQAKEWAASKQPMPDRIKEWKFSLLVGKSKRYGCKVHWQTEDGTEIERANALGSRKPVCLEISLQ